MNEQSSNEFFHGSSFMQGQNAEYLENLHSNFKQNPKSVDAAWQAFFQSLETDVNETSNTPIKPSWIRQDWPQKPNDEFTSALTGEWSADAGIADRVSEQITAKANEANISVSDEAVERAVLDSIRAIMIIRAHRIRGHLVADLDPLGLRDEAIHPELDPKSYGFRDEDLDRPIFIDNVLGIEAASLRQILSTLKDTYCGSIGVEYLHIQDPEQKSWIQQRIENIRNQTDFTDKGKEAIYERLVDAESFERFLNKKYTGTKRFGLDGSESVIPAIEQIAKRGSQLGLEEIVIGMAHRGRLNVLNNILQKPFRAIISEFMGNPSNPEETGGSGDVKYHMGSSSDREFDGVNVHFTLNANPSHLEVVNPVVIGRVRAKQNQRNDKLRNKVLGLLIHGDAAFAGQGILAETFDFAELRSYKTGGTLHLIINNQIGFTTSPAYSRSSPYCTDVAKIVMAPIFHVNADDPESVVHLSRIATESVSYTHLTLPTKRIV